MNTSPKMKHDVFISFRSKDTRDNFVSHLCGCLRRKRIKTFLYDELPADERYEESLKAIEDSKYREFQSLCSRKTLGIRDGV